jgi:hypothetical protein
VNVYPFIEAEKQHSHTGPDGQRVRGNLARACELLKVSRSAYYAHAAAQAAGGTRRQREDAELAERIRHHHAASRGRNGAPRIHADLAEEGRRHGRKRVARLMREHAIIGRHRRRTRRTTIPDPAASARADLIGRDFTVDANKVNTRWCGDIKCRRRHLMSYADRRTMPIGPAFMLVVAAVEGRKVGIVA